MEDQVGILILARCYVVWFRMKSKKKSESGTEMTLSAILMKMLKPEPENRFSFCTTALTKSFALIEESTRKS